MSQSILESLPQVAKLPTTADILVVDDTPDNLRLLMEILLHQGHRVRPVADGELAITAAQLQPPDLVLLDIKMPKVDGFEVCRQLKADPRTQDVPVIFLTVLDESVDKVKGFAVGGIDYITKPFEASELLARVENQLRLRSLQQQLTEQNRVQQYLLDQYQITALALKESEEKFAKAFERSPIPISLAAVADGTYLDVNQEFSRQTGYTREESIGHTVLELNLWVNVEDRAQVLDIVKSQGYVRAFETSMRTKSGDIRDVLLSVELIHLNNAPYFLAAAEDITERKAAKRKLAAKTQELSEALDNLKETQDQLIQSAKMAALGNLVAGVAHEINTPVGTAIMMASTLENATGAVSTEVAQGHLTQTAFQNYLEVAAESSHLILENLNRAGELIQSFKQVAVDQTSLKARLFIMKTYLEEVITNLAPQLKPTPHTVAISGDEMLTLHSYPGAISQIITNLVVNSLIHAFSENHAGHIKISFATKEDRCLLIYRDDGVGIPPENLEKIFEPFFTTARHRGGSGLGLHVAYNLVTQKLQGTISVESEIGEGVEFTISLPIDLHSNRGAS